MSLKAMLDPKAKMSDRAKRRENIIMGNKREAEVGKYTPTVWQATERMTVKNI